MDGLLGTKDANSEAGSRLRAVTNGSAAVAYNYLDGSPLFGQITFSQSGQTRMTTTKSYDYLHPVRYRPHITRDGSQRPQRPEGGRSTRAGLSHGVNRLTRISSVPSASSVVSFDYAYNNANQRTSVTLGPDRSYWTYGYDNLGQLTNGVKYWYDGVPFSGQQFQYTFDDIGNRKQTKAGGDSNGQNLRVAWYTNTLLNQITNRTVPGSNDILGIAHASATVTVNGQSP